MNKVEWLEGNRIFVPEENRPRKPKKITGTRFAALLGKNVWQTPFQTWSQITKTYEPPFEDTKYTLAGKALEPKIIQYLKDMYFGEENVITPTDVYGEDYFTKTWGDFYREQPIFGGMWDALVKQPNSNQVEAVVEIKTSKRVEDWQDGPPVYYSLQAALYAKLLGVDSFYMVLSVLQDSDYENPEAYTPSSENTVVVPMSVSKDFPNMDYLLLEAEAWWEEYVTTYTSPKYDEKKDAEYLKALRTVTVEESGDVDMGQLLHRLDELKEIITKLDEDRKPLDNEYAELTKQLKEVMIPSMDEEDDRSVIESDKLRWTLTKTARETVDKKALAKDGLYEKYVTSKISYTLTNKAL